MSEQLQLRRGTSTQVAAFTGQQGEAVMDTTNNRLVINDGSTAGGWAAAKLAETITNTRTAVADAAYVALTTDRLIAYTSLTASRVVSLPTSASYPTGTRLLIVDESGSCSATKTITITPNGADTIEGANSSAVLAMAYGFIGLESNGAGGLVYHRSTAACRGAERGQHSGCRRRDASVRPVGRLGHGFELHPGELHRFGGRRARRDDHHRRDQL